MSMTKTVAELRSRGLKVDCVAWYPWVHKTMHMHNQPLGIDSCAILYIGGVVQATPLWSLEDVPQLTSGSDDLIPLTAVADTLPAVADSLTAVDDPLQKNWIFTKA